MTSDSLEKLVSRNNVRKSQINYEIVFLKKERDCLICINLLDLVK